MKNLLQRLILSENFKRYALLLSIALFLLSLTQNCYCTASGECDSGFSLPFFGWAGMYFGGTMFIWLANPVLFLAWQTIRRPNHASLILSMLAAFAALSFLFFKSIFEIDAEISAITHFMAGYWLWLASSWVMVAANVIALVKTHITHHAIAC